MKFCVDRIVCMTGLLGCLMLSVVHAADVGIRGGIAAPLIAAKESHSFYLVEVSGYLPVWHPTGWEIGLEADAGLLLRQGEGAFIGSLLPTARIPLTDRFTLQIQSGLGAMTQSQWGSLDLGGTFFYRGSLGLQVALSARLRLEGGFIHMCNAYIYDTNPGLDIVTIGLRGVW